jgi:hypothetical protein
VGGGFARRPEILGVGQARTGTHHKTSAHGHKLAVGPVVPPDMPSGICQQGATPTALDLANPAVHPTLRVLPFLGLPLAAAGRSRGPGRGPDPV